MVGESGHILLISATVRAVLGAIRLLSMLRDPTVAVVGLVLPIVGGQQYL